MALDTVFNVAQGTWAIGSSASQADADHVVRKQLIMSVRAAQIGAAAEQILICVPQASIEVVRFYMVSGLNIATDANNPLIHLAKGDLNGGALTNITSTAIDTDTAFSARVAQSGVISTTLATRTITVDPTAALTARIGLWLNIATQGTPADISEDTTLTFVVEYMLVN